MLAKNSIFNIKLVYICVFKIHRLYVRVKHSHEMRPCSDLKIVIRTISHEFITNSKYYVTVNGNF